MRMEAETGARLPQARAAEGYENLEEAGQEPHLKV